MTSTTPSGVSLGLDTFGDITTDASGALQPAHVVLREVVEQGVAADAAGVDHFGVGEHHRDDYAVASPETVLAAVAARTRRITLGSSVTVLSSDDPVRVYQRFATLDAISDGRAEITVGRGSFTESFPLFGQDLADYEVLFEEKLDLLARLATERPVTWQGTTRAGLTAVQVHPTTARGGLPVRVGVGGSPQSVVRAARHRLPLVLAVIGGEPARFRPYVDLYRRAVAELHGPDAEVPPVGVHSPGFVADTDEAARDLLFAHFKANRDRLGRERGWPPVTRDDFEAEARTGALFVGSPDTVAARVADTVRTLGVQRFDLKYANGPVPHEHLMHAVRLYGTEVAPRVRRLLAASGS